MIGNTVHPRVVARPSQTSKMESFVTIVFKTVTLLKKRLQHKCFSVNSVKYVPSDVCQVSKTPL